MPRSVVQFAPDKALPPLLQRSTAASPLKTPAHPRTSTQPKFSGGVPARLLAGGSDGLISLFQKITEIYLVGFFALDVTALWITRIVKGLTRGSDKYDASSDPTNQGLSPSALMRKKMHKKIEGLNWKNGAEEALREVLSGPLGFIVPAAVFSFAIRHGHNAAELGYGPLTQLKDTFAQHLQKSPINGAQHVTPEQYRSEFRNFMRDILGADHDMLSKTIGVEGPGKGRTYAQYIDDWSDRWVKAAGDSLQSDLPGAERKTVRAALEKLNTEFEETVVKGYNRKVRLGDRLYDHNIIKTGLVGKAEQPLDSLLTNLTRFKDFASDIFKTREAQQAAQKSTGKLSDIAQTAYQKLVGKKFFFAMAATVIASGFMYIIPRISQRNKDYPANRLLMEGGGDNPRPSAAAAPGATPESAQQQPQPSLLPQPQRMAVPQ